MVCELERKKRRALRARYRLHKNNKRNLPRLSVFLSNRFLYVQIIDDAQSQTLASCSTKELNQKNITCAHAELVGLEIAKRALVKDIQQVVFDKGSYFFGPRLAALLKGVRAGNLTV